MLYKIVAAVIIITGLTAVPDFDNFEEQECHFTEECE